MAIVKQRSGRPRRWFDRLPHMVSVCALLTLICAAAASLLGQRLNALALTQKAAEMAEKTRQDEQLSAALSEAKAEWERERMSLEKALLAAKLKFNAERTTSANIRKRLAVLQKEVATLREGSAAKLGIVAGPQKPASPPAAAPSAPAPTPATTAAAATTAATTIAAGGPETSKTSAPPGATAPSPLLDVPDAEEAASE